MFLNGKCVDTIEPNIKKNLELCRWHTPEDLNCKCMLNDYTGYTNNNQVFDNCRTIYLQKLGTWEKNYKRTLNDFEKYKSNFNLAIDNLKKLYNTIKTKETTEYNITKIDKILNDGYKFIKIHGNKRKKQLDEIEVEKLTKELKSLKDTYTTLDKQLKNIEQYMYDILKLTYTYTLNYVKTLNFKWNNYKDTISLYNNYLRIYNSTISKIDNYDTILSTIQNDLEESEITIVKHKRNVRYQTSYYIDEHGNKHQIKNEINQVIIHDS